MVCLLQFFTGKKRLSAWSRFIINDTYRSELCLLYPPHLIAIAAIYLTVVLHVPTRAVIQGQRQAEQEEAAPQPPRRSSRQANNASTLSLNKKANQDIIGFFAGLNVSMPLIATIAQEIISLYALWDRYKEDGNTDSARGSFTAQIGSPHTLGVGPKRPHSGTSRSGSLISVSNGGTPGEGPRDVEVPDGGNLMTPAFLTQLLVRMRENRLADVAHPASGRPVAVNKMLERTQAAG